MICKSTIALAGVVIDESTTQPFASVIVTEYRVELVRLLIVAVVSPVLHK